MSKNSAILTGDRALTSFYLAVRSTDKNGLGCALFLALEGHGYIAFANKW